MSEVALEEKVQTEQAEAQESNANPESQEASTPEAKEAPASADELHDSFLKEHGLADETEDSDSSAKSEVTNTPDGTDAEVQRRVQETLQAERERENQNRQREGVRKDFGERTNRIRNYLAGKITNNQPLTYQDIEGIVGEFNAHHGQVLLLAKEDAQKEFGDGWADTLIQSAEKTVPGIGKDFKSIPDFVSRLTEKAREGYTKDAEVNKKVKAGIEDYREYLRGKGILPGSKEVPEGKGRSSARPRDIKNMTPEEIADWMSTPEGYDEWAEAVESL